MSVWKRLGVVVAAVSLLLLGSGISAAQVGGSIAGNVKDSTGGSIPGATVEVESPALIEKVRTTVTDGQGNYRITDLRPGTYAVTVRLDGFKTYRREGIELSAGFTAPVNAELSVGALEETVTVTGAAPIVDVQSAGSQSVLRTETLNALPSGQQDLTQVASLTLGAMPSSGDRNDVGGDKGSQSTGISIHGSRGDDGRLSFDGFNANVFFGGSGGQQTTYQFNTVAIAEQVVDTSGNSARTETGGANVNMVPREGGNGLSLIGTAFYTNESLSAGAVPDSLVSRGSADEVKSLKVIYDYGAGIGGPIMKDKIWFFSANRVWGSQTYGAANNYFNKSDVFYRYEPDTSRPVYSDTYFRDYGGRITLQATDKQKVGIQIHYQRGCRCWQGITGGAAPEAQYSFFYTPHYVAQGTWSYPATNRLLVRAGAGYMYQGVEFSSFGYDLPSRRRVTNINDPERGTYIWGGTFGGIVFNDNGERQRQDNVSYFSSASYITGSFDIEFGFDGQWGMFQQKGNPFPADGYDFTFTNGLPLQITQNAGPFRSDGRVKKLGLFSSIRYKLDRLTITGALRYDRHHSFALPVEIPAGPFIGARTYDGVDALPRYQDITPRVGAAYDLFGNGRTALRASWGRYLVGLGGGALSNLSPSNATVASASRLWFDNPANPLIGGTSPFTGVRGDADFVPDCDLTNFAANGECGPLNAGGFGVSRPAYTWDANAREGWGVREYSYQWSLAVQHELMPNFGVSAGYYHTEFRNQQIQVNTALTAADFNTYCVTAPTDTRIGGASGQEVCGLYNQTLASLTTAPQNVWYRIGDAPVPGLSGTPKEYFDGVELSMNYRYGKGALLSGGLSLGRTRTDTCFANAFPQITAIGQQGAAGQTTLNLNTARSADYCTNAAQKLWDSIGSQVKLQAVYPLPGNFIVSGTFKHLPGVSRTANVQYGNALIAPSLGRNLSACGNVTGACGVTQTVNIDLPGQLRDDRLTQVDLRFQRRFQIGKARFAPVFEIYNVTNTRAPQGSFATWGIAPSNQNPSFYRPTVLLGGRLFKFGTQIDF
ncbi:MAG: carboxypeptidase regulatory-like domain-containing protein [Vicinamibacterales bacterium]